MKVQVTLTIAELNHIHGLLDMNEEEGWYFGNKEQYWKRHERLKEKLQDLSHKQEKRKNI